MVNYFFSVVLILLFWACGQPPQRNCTDFKTGEFTFTTVIDGEEKKTTFHRTLDTEVDFYDGKRDTSSVRWINDCEYILKNKNPKSKAEEKSIHIKILTTSDSSYTFEYNAVGDKRKFKGTAHKIN
ncbi:MAG: DNA topoisomerase IV [Flavobacteriaceae bacterium]|jgi:hypothetical protein|uniref:DNA topoisomerase IV n=1 Tax=Flagellimonas TaxID=444459 RepID=UPI000E2484DA|nr:DNA topoisomerase IV [Allomuricauda sp.]MCR9263157.1 DNA topoisomerase IV [Flavobacteriaceae bacterium]